MTSARDWIKRVWAGPLCSTSWTSSRPHMRSVSARYWPVSPPRVQRVAAVAVFGAAVHGALPVGTGALAVRAAFWVGARVHDDGGAQLGLAVLHKQAKVKHQRIGKRGGPLSSGDCVIRYSDDPVVTSTGTSVFLFLQSQGNKNPRRRVALLISHFLQPQSLGGEEATRWPRRRGVKCSGCVSVYCCISWYPSYKQGSYVDRWISRTLNQMSTTKRKSWYKHEKFRKCCVLRAYAGFYFERLSLKNILIMSNSA